MDRDAVFDILQQASWRHRDLCGSRVDVITSPIDPLQFHRDYVAANKPCIIRGAIEEWPALSKWDKAFFRQELAVKEVPVSITPNGRADAVAKLDSGKTVFALPLESQMPMSEFLDNLTRPAFKCKGTNDKKPRGGNIIYMQQQNDCLRQNFPELLSDILADDNLSLAWADAIFGEEAEAINLWIGNKNSVTSFHKDHYENFFAVIRGQKSFTLLPPNDIYRLYVQKYSLARYRASNEGDLDSCDIELVEQEPESEVNWSPIDPNIEVNHKYPLFFTDSLPKPIKVDVCVGDVLYLPSLWHHHVQQDNDIGDICIAVNFWYDMAMGSHYANFCLAEDLSRLVHADL